jgi:hypothetical protein
MQVSAQDWRAVARINFLEADRFTMAMTKDRLASGCPHLWCQSTEQSHVETTCQARFCDGG